MDLIYLLYLFLNALVFTLIFTLVIGNQGPWNNPMFFFLVLFLTSWTTVLWMGQNMFDTNMVAYLYGTGVTAIVALLLAATETPLPESLRGVKSKSRIRKTHLNARSEGGPLLIRPNIFFWILLTVESCLIMLAYFLQYKQNLGI